MAVSEALQLPTSTPYSSDADKIGGQGLPALTVDEDGELSSYCGESDSGSSGTPPPESPADDLSARSGSQSIEMDHLV